MLNDWVFKNDKFIQLTYEVKLEDVKSFGFDDCFHYDVIKYLRYALVGVKKYLMGDKDENLPRNRVIYKRLKLLDQVVKALPFVIAFYYIFVKHDLINVCKSFFHT